jgi:hypothetical protein
MRFLLVLLLAGCAAPDGRPVSAGEVGYLLQSFGDGMRSNPPPPRPVIQNTICRQVGVHVHCTTVSP